MPEITLYQQCGGHQYRDGLLWPIEAPGCGSCRGDQCQAGDACMKPEPEPARRSPIFATAKDRAFALAGAAMGLCAAGALAQHFGVF